MAVAHAVCLSLSRSVTLKKKRLNLYVRDPRLLMLLPARAHNGYAVVREAAFRSRCWVGINLHTKHELCWDINYRAHRLRRRLTLSSRFIAHPMRPMIDGMLHEKNGDPESH